MTNKMVITEEIMSLEELDNVSGGNRQELALDTKLFKALGYFDRSYTANEINNDNLATIQARVATMWKNLGIDYTYKDFAGNLHGGYSRNQAIQQAIYQAGRANEIAPQQFYA